MSITGSAGWVEQVTATVRRRLARARAFCLDVQGTLTGDEEAQMASARYRLIADLEAGRPLPYLRETRRTQRRGPERRRRRADATSPSMAGPKMGHCDGPTAPILSRSEAPTIIAGGDSSAHLIGIPKQPRHQPVSFLWQ